MYLGPASDTVGYSGANTFVQIRHQIHKNTADQRPHGLISFSVTWYGERHFGGITRFKYHADTFVNSFTIRQTRQTTTDTPYTRQTDTTDNTVLLAS